MKIIELAQEIFTSSLNSPTDIGVLSISFWLTENIGMLNNALGKDFSIDADGQITQNLNNKEISIFKKFYILSYYDFQIQKSLGAAAISPTLQVSDFGTTVRIQNKNELAKSWLQLKKSQQEQLDEEIINYNNKGVRPVQTVGDDIIWSENGGLSNSITDSSI